MATSGVEVDPGVCEILDSIKSRKKRFCFLKISEDSKSICACVDENCQEEDDNLADLKATPEHAEECTQTCIKTICKRLKENPTTPRYIYTNLVVNNKGRNVDKMILFVYNPDNARIKDKMLYASSKDALKKVITTSFVDMQISEISDLEDFAELRTNFLLKSGST